MAKPAARIPGIGEGEAEVTVDDDASLVRRCLSQDPAALREFVDRFQPQVFAICWRMLGHREDAEDVTQEVFLRSFRHLAGWDPARPLRPWVLAIAANRCRTRLGLKRQADKTIDGLSELAADRSTATTDLAEELQRAIAGLRDDYRACFVLFYQQELSVQDVADALQIPTGTVKTWLYRARKELAETLRQRGVVTETGYELHGT